MSRALAASPSTATRSKKPTIPQTLYYAAIDPRNSRALHFNAAGDAIVIPDLQQFTLAFESLFETTLSGFWSTIGRYQFTRIKSTNEHGGERFELSHPNIRRGNLQLLAGIKQSSSLSQTFSTPQQTTSDEGDYEPAELSVESIASLASAASAASTGSMAPPESVPRGRSATIGSIEQLKSSKAKSKRAEDAQAGVALRLKMLEDENAHLTRRLKVLEAQAHIAAGDQQSTRAYLWRNHDTNKLRGTRITDVAVASASLMQDLIGELERAGALPNDLNSVSHRREALARLGDAVWQLGSGPDPPSTSIPRIVQQQQRAQPQANPYAHPFLGAPVQLQASPIIRRSPTVSVSQSRIASPTNTSHGSFSRESSVAPGSLLSPMVNTGTPRPPGHFTSPSAIFAPPTNASPQIQRRSPSPFHQQSQPDQLLYLPSPGRLLKRSPEEANGHGLGIDLEPADKRARLH